MECKMKYKMRIYCTSICINCIISGYIMASPINSNDENMQNSNLHKLDAVVTTATGSAHLQKDAPASITVITQKDIESKPHKDLAEVLAGIPGIDIGQGMGRSGNAEISIRGMPSEYTLILIDGKRQNVSGAVNTFNNGYQQTDNNFFPPLNAIEKIEIIRGPLSTLYGSDAMGGVINIITKKHIDKYSVSLNLETTQNEHRYFGQHYVANLFSVIPIIKDVLGVQIRGRYYYHSPSNITLQGPILTTTGDNNNNINKYQLGQIVTSVPDGGIGNATEGQIYDIGGRILWNADSNNHIYFDTQFSRQWYDNSKEQWGPHTSVASDYIIMRNNSILAHEGRFNHWSIQNSMQLNQTYNDGRLNSLNNPATPRNIEGRDYILESKAFIDLPFDNNLSVGMQYWYAYMQDLMGNPSNFSQHTIALFAENEWEALDNLKLTLSLREDYNSRFSFHTTPKAYIVYEPLQDWLVVKWGIASGYKAPYLNELIDGPIGLGNQGNRVTIGNPNLKPETSLSTELTLLSDNDYISTGATYFYTFFWDKITNVSYKKNDSVCANALGNACARRENVDMASIQGLELFVNMKPIYNIGFDISYTFTHSNQLSGSMKGYPLENTLAHLLYSKLSWDYKKLHIYLIGEAQGGRFRGLDSNKNPIRYDILGNYYKPFFLMHLGGQYQINKNLKIGFAIYNLFDVNFIDFRQADFYPNASTKKGLPYFFNMYNVVQEGRRYYLSLNVDF